MKAASEPGPSAQQRLRRIEGRHNPLVKQLRLAFSRAELTETGDCAIEGLRILEEAIRSGLRLAPSSFVTPPGIAPRACCRKLELKSKPFSFPTNYSTASSPANPRKAWPLSFA